jgi:hypothetical protein
VARTTELRHAFEVDQPPLNALLQSALASGDDRELRTALAAGSGLPGPRLNLRLVDELAGAVGDVVRRADPPVERVAGLLDRWAHLSVDEAPGDRPEVILPCAAVAAYGEVAAARPDWWDDEIAKLRRAARDPRWRVRELVAQGLQRALDADWPRAAGELRGWAGDDDPLVVRAAAAGVAEPRLLGEGVRAADALEVQRRCARRYRSYTAEERRTDPVKVLRKALGFTVSVAVAATGDFGLLEELVAAATGDRDLRWVVRENLKKARLRPWPQEVERLRLVIA